MIEGLQPYPDYRASEMPWVGTIPTHWQEKRAKFLFREVDERSETGHEELLSVSHKTGVTPRSQKNVTMFKAESYAGHKLCRPNDLVINTMWAWMGALGISRDTGIISPAYGVYRPRSGSALLPKFADAVLRTPTYIAEYICRSTGIRSSRLRLYPESFLRVPIVFPPPDEQAAIVKFLDHADRRIRRYIRAKQKLIKLLEEQKQAIIHQAVTRGLNPNVKLKPSGVPWLGDVPEHWEVRSVGSAARMVQTGPFGSQVHASDYVAGGVPLINPTHITPDGIRADVAVAVSVEKAQELGRHRLEVGDIVLSRRGELGRCAAIVEEAAGYLCGTGSLKLKLQHCFDPEFFVLIFSSWGIRAVLGERSAGATMPNLNAGVVARLIVPCPALPEQADILADVRRRCAKVRASTETIIQECRLLQEYRTRLISDVVTGKLDVRHAAASLPDDLGEDEPALDAEEELDEELEEAGEEGDE